jgi:hypothetical protein
VTYFPLIAQQIADRLHPEKQQGLLGIDFYPQKQGLFSTGPRNWCDEYFLLLRFSSSMQYFKCKSSICAQEPEKHFFLDYQLGEE